MKTEVFDDKTNNSAFGLVKVLPDYQEYNSLRRPVYRAMFHPLAFYLSRFTAMPIVPLYAIVQSVDLIKCTVGYILIKKGVWVNNIVA